MKKVLTALLSIGLLLPVFCFGEAEDEGKGVQLKDGEFDYLESLVVGVKDAEKLVKGEGKDVDRRVFYNGDNIDKARDLFIFYKTEYIVTYQIVDEKGELVLEGSSSKEVKPSEISTKKDRLEQVSLSKSGRLKPEEYEKIENNFKGKLYINTLVAKDGCRLICKTYKRVTPTDDEQTFVGSCTFKKGDLSDADQTFDVSCTFKKGAPPKDEFELVESRTFNIIEPGWQYFSLQNISIAPIISFAVGKRSNGEGSKSTSTDFGLGISYMFFHKTERHNISGSILFGINTSFSRTDILNESSNLMEPTIVFNLCGSLGYKFRTFLIQGNVGYGNVTGKDHYLQVSFGLGKLL